MRVAVIDDSKEDAQKLLGFIRRFEQEEGITLHTSVFYASFDFLEEYQGEYEVIFLDIDMPGSNGLEVAREIRSKDNSVGIVFVTSLAQYAINGYEVNAIDFMVKPVLYYNFSLKLKKAIQFCEKRGKYHLLINDKNGVRRLPISDIYYIEKEQNDLVFHTRQGELRCRKSMKEMKESLKEQPFEECISGCLVNFDCVSRIGKDVVELEVKTELPLSRRLKKQFSREYIRYMGGRILICCTRLWKVITFSFRFNCLFLFLYFCPADPKEKIFPCGCWHVRSAICSFRGYGK